MMYRKLHIKITINQGIESMKKIILLLSVSLGLAACTASNELNKYREPEIAKTSINQMCNNVKVNKFNDRDYIDQYITFSGQVSISKHVITKNKSNLLVINKNNYFHINNYPNLDKLINGNQITMTGKITSIDTHSFSDNICSFSINYYK